MYRPRFFHRDILYKTEENSRHTVLPFHSTLYSFCLVKRNFTTSKLQFTRPHSDSFRNQHSSLSDRMAYSCRSI
ncbi:hypothetical protein WG66_017087 [Moniliophthora roreri]|nr:hypothetical protein WG66_017087 [Moniliophthora roreri]